MSITLIGLNIGSDLIGLFYLFMINKNLASICHICSTFDFVCCEILKRSLISYNLSSSLFYLRSICLELLKLSFILVLKVCSIFDSSAARSWNLFLYYTIYLKACSTYDSASYRSWYSASYLFLKQFCL